MGKSKFKAKGKRDIRMAATKAKRIRKDTFGTNTDQANAQYFNEIYDGQSEIYTLDRSAHVKTDYKGRLRHCWAVVNKQGDRIGQVRSAKAYRLAVLWSIHYAKVYWSGGDDDSRLAALKNALPSIKGKRGDHSRHRCGHEWCCNPGHIIIGSRAANEMDKHFHYFLNHKDASIRQQFMETFGWLCKQKRLF